MRTTIEYQIVGDDGEWHAGSTSIKEALHYLAVYRQDGPVHLEKVMREVIDITIDAPPPSRQPQELSDFLNLTSEGEAAEEMLRTAKELRYNANGDPNAIQQAIYWEQKAKKVAPQPAQTHLEVVGLLSGTGQSILEAGESATIHHVSHPHASALIPLVRLTDAQAHIAALTAKVRELTETNEYNLHSAGTWSEAYYTSEAKVEELTRERDEYAEFERQHNYCCCGSRMEDHDIGSGHSPVSMFDYEYSRAVDRAETAEARIAKLEKVLKEIASYSLDEDEFNSYYNYRAIVTKAKQAL